MEKINNLLIVDDDTTNLMELIHILQPDYKIYTAKNGMYALEKAEMLLPDLILLDVIMPGMSGFDVITEMKKSEKTKDIPVIFITGISESDDEGKGLDLGAADYIRKPFNASVVKHRVRRQIQIINLKHEIITALEEIKTAAQNNESEKLISVCEQLSKSASALVFSNSNES